MNPEHSIYCVAKEWNHIFTWRVFAIAILEPQEVIPQLGISQWWL